MAALALSLAGTGMPGHAQQTGTPAPTPAPTPTPSPTPSIDFRLPDTRDGRQSGVQGPADNGIPPLAPGEDRGLPTPAPTAPRIVPTRPQTTPTPAPAPTPAPTRRETPAPARAAPSEPAAPPAPEDRTPVAPTAESGPVPVTAPESAPPTADDEATATPAPAPAGGGTPLWAWLLAGLAAAGAGVWYWRRRPVPAGDVPADSVETPAEAPAPAAERTATPAPASLPVAAPPQPVTVPQPASGPRAASPLVTRPAAEQRAQVSMALAVQSIRMTAEHMTVGFSLELTNNGSVAATGLMVRIALGQGSAMQEAVLARFFDGAGGSVLRDDIELAPGAGERLDTEATLPRAGIEPLAIAGKPMLVPVLVFDVTYHWDGDADAFGQTAGSYVLGRAPAPGTGDRLAPLPLDRPSYAVDRPGARATAMRRTL